MQYVSWPHGFYSRNAKVDLDYRKIAYVHLDQNEKGSSSHHKQFT